MGSMAARDTRPPHRSFRLSVAVEPSPSNAPVRPIQCDSPVLRRNLASSGQERCKTRGPAVRSGAMAQARPVSKTPAQVAPQRRVTPLPRSDRKSRKRLPDGRPRRGRPVSGSYTAAGRTSRDAPAPPVVGWCTAPAGPATDLAELQDPFCLFMAPVGKRI